MLLQGKCYWTTILSVLQPSLTLLFNNSCIFHAENWFSCILVEPYKNFYFNSRRSSFCCSFNKYWSQSSGLCEVFVVPQPTHPPAWLSANRPNSACLSGRLARVFYSQCYVRCTFKNHKKLFLLYPRSPPEHTAPKEYHMEKNKFNIIVYFTDKPHSFIIHTN